MKHLKELFFIFMNMTSGFCVSLILAEVSNTPEINTMLSKIILISGGAAMLAATFEK